MLSSAIENTHGKEMAELILGLKETGNLGRKGTGFRGYSLRGEK